MITSGYKRLSSLQGFRHLSPKTRQQLSHSLRLEQYSAGSIVLREGDFADRLFIIEQGCAEVTSRDAQGNSCLLASLGPGELFGEVALLEDSKLRQATVTALEPLSLLSLDANIFKALLDSQPAFRDEFDAAVDDLLVAKFLKQSSPFIALETAHTRRLASRLRRLRVEAETVILREGACDDESCYLVRSGLLEVVVGEPSNNPKQLTTLGPGMLFGEAALLTDAPRNATVRALEKTELLELRRSDLLDAMTAKRDVSERILGLHVLRARPRRIDGVEMHQRQSVEGEQFTVLKKPWDRTYFQLSEQGRLVWEHLDGEHTLRELTLEMVLKLKVFAPDNIVQLIERLSLAGFVEQRSLRSDVNSVIFRLPLWRHFLITLSKYLNWQMSWRGVDPFFGLLHRSGLGLLLKPVSVAVLSVIAAGGLGAGLVHRSEWLAALKPDASEHWFALLLGVIVSVVIHELSHGLAVKSCGRTVPRIGIGWHWLTPIVFIDTSDIWLSNRQARVWVSVAGPLSNLVLAGIAAGIASALTPSPLSLWQLATINLLLAVINLSPLLELDGYYVLMDVLEKPRLRSRALAWALRPTLPCEHRAELIYLGATGLSLVMIGAFVWTVFWPHMI